MIFPIGDTNIRNGTRPIFSYLFILINVLVFLYEASLTPALFEDFLYAWGTVPRSIMHGEQLHTLFTSMFLHGGRMHLIGNMLFLRVFGDNIEKRLGNIPFYFFYIVGGVVASMTHILLDQTSTIAAVGASGAISAVLGAYLLMFPHSRIKVLYLYHMRVFRVPAVHFLGYWIVFQMISGVGALAAAGGGGGVAWRAHIGGFAFGALIGSFYRKK